jgi:hypothetical protein
LATFSFGGFLETQEAVLKVEAIEGEPRLAAVAETGAEPSAAVQIWRNADTRVHPLRSTSERRLTRPGAIKGNVLNEADVLRASGLPSIDQHYYAA